MFRLPKMAAQTGHSWNPKTPSTSTFFAGICNSRSSLYTCSSFSAYVTVGGAVAALSNGSGTRATIKGVMTQQYKIVNHELVYRALTSYHKLAFLIVKAEMRRTEKV
jgi:hypothetical protein